MISIATAKTILDPLLVGQSYHHLITVRCRATRDNVNLAEYSDSMNISPGVCYGVVDERHPVPHHAYLHVVVPDGLALVLSRVIQQDQKDL